MLFPLDQAAIVPKVVSPVKKWMVERGSHVKAGQLLGELEKQDLAGALVKSQGGAAQAQTSYEMAVQKGAQDLKFAKQSWTRHKSYLTAARSCLRRAPFPPRIWTTRP